MSRLSVSRRAFLADGLRGAGTLTLGMLGGQLAVPAVALAAGGGADTFGPLQGPDPNGLLLPAGFTSRIVARADEPPAASSSFNWHRFPDGGAVFPSGDGGWVYASNSERGGGGGGVGALRFAPGGTAIDAYRILGGTSTNCAAPVFGCVSSLRRFAHL